MKEKIPFENFFAHNWLFCLSAFLGLETRSKSLLHPMSRLFRLTTIRERRVLTATGWVALSMVLGLVLVSMILFIHSFLAPIKPVEGSVLVVVGQFPDYSLKEIKDRFEEGHYKLLVTVGGKYKTGHPMAQYKSAADWTASRLNAQGVLLGKIIPVSITIYPRKDRTYHKALAVQKRLNKAGFAQASIDVVSSGVHARRTWLLFEKVFPSVDVGIIAIRPDNYDTSRWWLFSEGVRSVISESVAYLYARFIFSPSI